MHGGIPSPSLVACGQGCPHDQPPSKDKFQDFTLEAPFLPKVPSGSPGTLENQCLVL